MEEFHIPLKPEDLARPSVREDEYRVENEVHPELMKEKDLLKLLDDAEGRLLPNSTHQIVSHKNFDMIFGFLNNFASLSSSVRRQLLDLLLRGIGNLTQAISKLITTDKESLEPEAYSHRLLVHKNALKMYTFLLSWLISSLEKSSAAAAEIKPKGKAAGGKKKKADEDSENFWDSESLKEQVLSALVHILEIDLSRVWNLALPEETFLNAISNTMTTLLENPANCKLKSVRRCIFISLGLLVQRYKQAAPLTNALFHRLHNHEHLSSVLAQLMEVLCKEYDSPQVVGEFLREISRMNSKDVPQDSASVRNISTFIGELAELVPQQVLSNVSLLLVHLDSESYTMRNGVIHMVGRLLASNLFANDAANNGNDKHEAAQTRDSLFKILEDRFHDMNAFCRSKTLQTWAYLLSLHSQQRRIIPLKVLPVVTKLTIGRLEDKGARVREHAIQLLTTLLEANPFGPSLKLSEFRAKLEEGKKALAESEAKGAEADAETEKLRRSLQYYHDSTHFIEQLHSAVPVLGRLLGSKVNADVLETINFFVSATQFQLECASQGTRKMLPLIWSREAPIREAVTVAYEKLYANLAAVPSKAGAMHVAKNLIALTEGATLAEITSLEELVAMMMAKRSIPPPVIYLLWEIFGLKHPEVQPQESRGALVILSMIATSSPEMVKEKLPVLLGQGLGPRWKDDELLAKYSCIALQKLNDRADKTAQPAPRLRAEHEVFAKLSDVIKDPSPRTQWYSAAEQAVAAVYKLHERPDDLCSSLIKEMAANLFDETSPKATSSSELSKFVFVLGHVALKQLVHIEEIQSEMRRRREANEKKKEAGGAGKEKGDQAKDTQQSQKKKKSAIEEELGLVHGVTDETEADRLREVAERELVGKSLLGQFGALIVKICASPDKYTNPMLRSSAVLALCKFMCVSEPFCREQLPLMFTLLEKSEDSAIRSNIVIALGDMSLRFPNLIEPWTANIYARLRDRDERVKKNALMVLMHLILNDMIKVKGQVYEMAICMESEDSRIAELARLFFSELSRKGNHLYNILPDVISHLSVAPNLSSDAFKSIMKYLLAFIEKDKQTEALVEKLCHRFKNPAQDTVRTPEAEVTHARDVAFCLTVLNYNERVLKKLAECFKLYADKLVDDEVYNCIQQVLAKGRKSSQSKAETKTVIDELAARVEQAHATGVVDGRPMEGLKKPPSVRAAKPAAAKKARGAKPKARAAKAVSDDEEEELLSLSEDDDDSPPARAAPAEGGKGASRAAPQRRAAAKAKAKAVRKAEESSESESESDGGADEKRPAPKRRVASSDDDAASEVAKAPKAKTGAKRKAKAKAKVASDEEEAEPKKAASDKEADEEEVRKPAARKGRKQIVEDDDSDE